ncbi:MAG: NAD(P)/FAD-dependent oxidoreductase [Burkholderiales bacterium]|nr:NAD(P)/FAD-dependent oxidoreductase [Burkholderiales bacterium]
MKPHCVAIIGGGASGLAAGVALARQGVQVKLFEANAKVGGCCATTELGGYTFNDGALYIAVPALLDIAFERLGLSRADLVPLRPILAPQSTQLPDGTVVTIGAGRQVTVQAADGRLRPTRLPVEIDAMMRKWRPVLQLFTHALLPYPFSTHRLLSKAWRHLPKFHGTLARELRALFSDPAERAAMAGILLYSGLPADQAPVAQIVGLAALFDEGFFVPVGGMGTIPQALREALCSLGGEIHTQTPVDEIKVAGHRAQGVVVRGQGFIAADAVISTLSGMLTFGQLLSPTDVPVTLQKKVARALLSHRALSLQLGLTNRLDVSSHAIGVLPFMEAQTQLLRASRGQPAWFTYTVPTVTMPELAPPGCSIIEMFPPVDAQRAPAEWDDAAVLFTADAAIAALSLRHPMEIAVKRIRSPRDFRDQMHLFDGALYGLSPAATPWQQFSTTTPIDGLYLAGQTTYPGFGVSTSALSGIFAAEAVLGM